MTTSEIREKLIEKGLKVTPQRIAILEAIVKLNNHPTADNVIDYIRKNNPNIATATVYKVLDALVQNRLINKVKTDKDIMWYDASLEKHHHLYSSDSDRIEDYIDEELNETLISFFEKKAIPGFKIEDVKLQIIGKFL
jgi:Fur family peroxide stress response transcriptional regulator